MEKSFTGSDKNFSVFVYNKNFIFRLRVEGTDFRKYRRITRSNIMAGENGKNALQYLLEEVDGTVKSMEEQKPDFADCPVGASFAEQQFKGTLLMLKMQRIYVRENLEKSSKKDNSNGNSNGRWGFFKVGSNGVQASGVVALTLVLLYLVLKVHSIPILP